MSLYSYLHDRRFGFAEDGPCPWLVIAIGRLGFHIVQVSFPGSGRSDRLAVIVASKKLEARDRWPGRWGQSGQ